MTTTAVRGVALLFFLSGMSGLVYEVVWSRQLQHLFGVSSFAITTVIAAYMAGLALGSGIMGRIADRLTARQAVAAYGMLEILIGVFAFAFTPLLGGVAVVYHAVAGNLVGSMGLRVFVDFLLTFGLLLVPTTLMGGTLPLISRFFAAHAGRTGRGFGWAYALNTLGAVLGTYIAGFHLMHTLGLTHSLYLFGGVNFVIGGAAIMIGGAGPKQVRAALRRQAATERPAEQRPPAAELGTRTLLVLAALSGCVSLSSEIVWIRGFASLFLSTTYTFSLVLMVFLVGIALGSTIGAKLEPTRDALAATLTLMACATLTQLALYETAHNAVMDTVHAGTGFGSFLVVQALIIAVIVFPLTLCSGAALPLIIGLSSRGLGRAGRDVGRVYIANTIGSVLGTILAGFCLLPLLGATTGARGLSGLALAGALLARVWRNQWGFAAAAAAVLAVILPNPPLDRQALSPVLLAKRSPEQLPPGGWREALRPENKGFQPIRVAHGITADIALTLTKDVSARSLWINGMPNASSFGDQGTQLSMAILPYLYAPSADRCLHIGLGSGITTGVWAALPETGRTRVVELEAELWDVTRDFRPFHYGLHDNPKVEFVVDDARSHLEMVHDASFDVIASEPSQLWSKGVGNLFTTGFFKTVKRKLAPRGVFMTWVMGYEVPAEVWAVALGTLLDEFDHVFAFCPPAFRPDVMFVCSREPLTFHDARWNELMHLKGVKSVIPIALGLVTKADLAKYALADRATLVEAVHRTLAAAGMAGARNTADLPLLEYLYPRTVVSKRIENTLLNELIVQRFRRDARTAGEMFLMPPGLEGVAPTFETLLDLTREIPALPYRKLTGLRGVGTALAKLSRLDKDQLLWTYVAAVAGGKWKIAKQVWPRVKAYVKASPRLQERAIVHLQYSRDPAIKAEILAALPFPSIATPTTVLRRQLDACLTDKDKTAGAKRYVRMFLAAVPPRRFVLQKVHRTYIENLVGSAYLAKRMSDVETYLRRIDTLFDGRQFYAALALTEILALQERADEARTILARYDAWTIADPYRARIRRRLLGPRR